MQSESDTFDFNMRPLENYMRFRMRAGQVVYQTRIQRAIMLYLCSVGTPDDLEDATTGVTSILIGNIQRHQWVIDRQLSTTEVLHGISALESQGFLRPRSAEPGSVIVVINLAGHGIRYDGRPTDDPGDARSWAYPLTRHGSDGSAYPYYQSAVNRKC